MPINCYTGLMGSGKSFEAVSSVIVPAIMAGRNVVTNVEGINSELIRDYICEKHGKKSEDLGHVIHCTNEDIDVPNFFPVPITDELGFQIEPWIPMPEFTFYARAFKASQGKDLGKTGYQIMLRNLTTLRERGIDIGSCLVQAGYKDGKEVDLRDFLDAPIGSVFCEMPEVRESVVKPGDLVCIDEAWRFWGTQCKISGEHRVFFREHRHYVSPKTHVSCDLVLMVQDISDLHRTLKVVVEMTFRTSKLKSLGLSKTYRVEMWEGYKLARSSRIAMEIKKYNAEIFPLYSSYTGGTGVELQVDDRQNIFKSKKLWVICALVIGLLSVSVYGLYGFFNPEPEVKKKPHSSSGTKPIAGYSNNMNIPRPISLQKLAAPPLSNTYRIVGSLDIGGERLVMIAGPGVTRYVQALLFKGTGYQMTGVVDGETVSYYSGRGLESQTLTSQMNPLK